MLHHAHHVHHRKPLLIVSGIGMAAAQAMLAVNFLPQPNTTDVGVQSTAANLTVSLNNTNSNYSNSIISAPNGGEAAAAAGSVPADTSASDLVGRSPGLALASQCLYMLFFSVGFGPVCWILAAEVFPLKLRGR